MQFLDFLQSLAPEGETALMVRQKPYKREGELQYHADGALKCTWPAYLPSIDRIKPEHAWYGNTASFILDRFQEGRISASATNCEYCLVLVLDDVGTKSKEPPLAPTWIMETSPGSFQWGYAFTENQPTKGEFSAAIKAIADAGYTDPGATNPVRNFRLPGSINLKPGRNAFASRLVEFHPERMFDLPQICTALGVTPAEADSTTYRPVRVHDAGGDDVFEWLADRGLVLSNPNAEGWAGVVCPNAAEHTDGNPEGRYMPASRAYCCMHSHCVELDSVAFLAWVAEQGGPAHQPGVRDDLMAVAMQATLGKLEPSTFFTDDAKKVIEEVELREVARLDKAEWYHRFAYVVADDSYYDLVDRKEYSRSAFNAIYRHVSCQSIHTNRRVEASVCYDENRQAMGARVLAAITYAPGESQLVARDGDVYGNRWRDARPVYASPRLSAQPWLDHAALLVPEDEEREHLFDFMAFNPAFADGIFVAAGDINGDGAVNFSDINPFVALLSG